MAGPSGEREAKLGEARACAKQADSRYAVDMTRTAAFAPHLGAALGAALLLCTGLAFQAGAEGEAAMASPPVSDPRAYRPGEILSVSETVTSETSSNTENQSTRAGGLVRPRLAVMIDDVGLDPVAADRLLALDLPITLSILPYAEGAPEIAARAGAAGREVFLHLPMEPVGLDDPGPLALTVHMPGETLARRAEWALSRVPGAVGFNNHMGSRLTADPAAMDALFAPLAARGLIFVDSLTSPDSVAQARAAAAGLAALRRDVFLDHDRSAQAVSAAIDAALRRASEQGQAIAIGHPHTTTIEALETLRARADAAGVELVSIGALVPPGPDRS